MFEFQYLLEVMTSILLMVAGWLISAVLETRSKTRQLHEWHKPDDQGRQTWKKNPDDHKELMTTLISLIQKIDRLITLYEAK